jgi:chemosensory pili system protein ChpA (sensor histidine kinase/response regulator)
MQLHDLNSSPAELDLTLLDLGPLAWVLEELRKSLEGATKALKRFMREAEASRDSDLAALDASQLRTARQQLHQAVGALEMVGMSAPALVLRAMETAVQKFIQSPALCTQDAAAKIELAGFSLIHYLENVLAGKPARPFPCFPSTATSRAWSARTASTRPTSGSLTGAGLNRCWTSPSRPGNTAANPGSCSTS